MRWKTDGEGREYEEKSFKQAFSQKQAVNPGRGRKTSWQRRGLIMLVGMFAGLSPGLMLLSRGCLHHVEVLI